MLIRLRKTINNQKKNFIELIDSGKILAAETALQFVREMWEEFGYGDDYREIENRLKLKHEQQISDAQASFAEEIRLTGR